MPTSAARLLAREDRRPLLARTRGAPRRGPSTRGSPGRAGSRARAPPRAAGGRPPSIARFACRSEIGAFRATCSASASASLAQPRRRGRCGTRAPSRAPRPPPTRRAVRMRSFARATPTSRGSRWRAAGAGDDPEARPPGARAPRPRRRRAGRTRARARARRRARRRSSRRRTAAARARSRRSPSRTAAWNPWTSSAVIRARSFRSAPAQKARSPAPVRTTARSVRSAAAASTRAAQLAEQRHR